MGVIIAPPNIQPLLPATSGLYEWTPSMLAATPTAGDVVAATEELADFMKVEGGAAIITNVEVFLLDDVAPALRIYLFDTNVALGTEDAAISISDANVVKGICSIPVAAADYTDMINSRWASLSTANFGIKKVQAAVGTKSIFAGIVSDSAVAFTAAGTTIRIGYTYL